MPPQNRQSQAKAKATGKAKAKAKARPAPDANARRSPEAAGQIEAPTPPPGVGPQLAAMVAPEDSPRPAPTPAPAAGPLVAHSPAIVAGPHLAPFTSLDPGTTPAPSSLLAHEDAPAPAGDHQNRSRSPKRSNALTMAGGSILFLDELVLRKPERGDRSTSAFITWSQPKGVGHWAAPGDRKSFATLIGHVIDKVKAKNDPKNYAVSILQGSLYRPNREVGSGTRPLFRRK